MPPPLHLSADVRFLKSKSKVGQARVIIRRSVESKLFYKRGFRVNNSGRELADPIGISLVELCEKYNELVEIAASFVTYRREMNKKLNQKSSRGWLSSIKEGWNEFREDMKMEFSPFIGISEAHSLMIDRRSSDEEKRHVYFNIYKSKHQIAALGDHILKEMPCSDFEALSKVHENWVNHLNVFNSVPIKIKGLLLALGAFAAGSFSTT